MRSDTYISINDEARPVVEVSPPGSVHEYPSPIAATGAIQRADSSAPRLSVQRLEQATAGEENVVSSSGLRASSAASTDETDSSSIGGNSNEAAKDEAKDEASGGAGGALNVEMSVDSAYSWVDDLLRIKIDLRVPMQSVSRTIDGVNLKLVDSKDRVSRLQPRCFPTPRNEQRPTTMKPTTNQLEFEWDEYKRRPSMPGIKLDVNVKGDAAAAAAAAEEVPAKPPRQQTTPEPPASSQISQEANRRTVREEAPRRTSGFVLEDIEKMLGIIPRVEKPSLLDKPGPVGAFAQTSNFVMNEPLKKMVEKQKQIRDEARATSSRPASAGVAVAASVPAPEAFRDRWISRATSTTTSTMTTTSTTTTTTLTTSTTRMMSSNQSDPPSYSTCVSQNDPARDQQQQRPALIHYAPPSYSAAVTQQFQQQLQNSKESFVSLLEHRRSTSTSSSNSGAETETRSSTWNLASFLKPPRMSPRPMISPSAPPYPANPEAEFYNKLIETAMKGAGPFANQLDIKDVLARTTTFPLMPEPWVPRPMRPYVIGNEEPYRGPETATEYMDQVRSSRAPVAAVPAQQRTTTVAQQQPRMTADELAACWEDLGATVARPPAPRTPNPAELRVETSHQRIDYGLRVRRDSAGAERSEWDLRIEPELRAAAAARRGPPTASPRRNELQLDPSVVTDLGMDLRTSLMRAGLPADLQNLNETEYDRALTEMHRVMERAKGMLDNLRK